MGDANKLFVYKSLLTMPSNVLPLHLKQTFPPIIWIFTEGDGIKSRLPFKIFCTLNSSSTGHHSRGLSTYWRIKCLWAWRCANLACPSSFEKPVRKTNWQFLDWCCNYISSITFMPVLYTSGKLRTRQGNTPKSSNKLTILDNIRAVLTSWQSDTVTIWRNFFLKFSNFFFKRSSCHNNDGADASSSCLHLGTEYKSGQSWAPLIAPPSASNYNCTKCNCRVLYSIILYM